MPSVYCQMMLASLCPDRATRRIPKTKLKDKELQSNIPLKTLRCSRCSSPSINTSPRPTIGKISRRYQAGFVKA